MSLKGRSCWVVKISLVRAEELSLQAKGRVVAAKEELRFETADRQQFYDSMDTVGQAAVDRPRSGLECRVVCMPRQP